MPICLQVGQLCHGLKCLGSYSTILALLAANFCMQKDLGAVEPSTFSLNTYEDAIYSRGKLLTWYPARLGERSGSQAALF